LGLERRLRHERQGLKNGKKVIKNVDTKKLKLDGAMTKYKLKHCQMDFSVVAIRYCLQKNYALVCILLYKFYHIRFAISILLHIF
jgi:hypothetical protein